MKASRQTLQTADHLAARSIVTWRCEWRLSHWDGDRVCASLRLLPGHRVYASLGSLPGHIVQARYLCVGSTPMTQITLTSASGRFCLSGSHGAVLGCVVAGWLGNGVECEGGAVRCSLTMNGRWSGGSGSRTVRRDWMEFGRGRGACRVHCAAVEYGWLVVKREREGWATEGEGWLRGEQHC